jgi:hypothetical protein
MLTRIIAIAFVLLGVAAARGDHAVHTLLGTWRWSEDYTDTIVQRDLTLRAGGNFALSTSYTGGSPRGGTDVGWWRIEHEYLLLNFWFDPGDADVPCQTDLKLKIISVNKQHFRFMRLSEEIVAQRIR